MLSVKQLKSEAKSRGLKGYSKMTKNQLVDLLLDDVTDLLASSMAGLSIGPSQGKSNVKTPASPASPASSSMMGSFGKRLPELKSIAKELGIKGIAKMRKPQLMEAIAAAQAPKATSRARSKSKSITTPPSSPPKQSKRPAKTIAKSVSLKAKSLSSLEAMSLKELQDLGSEYFSIFNETLSKSDLISEIRSIQKTRDENEKYELKPDQLDWSFKRQFVYQPAIPPRASPPNAAFNFRLPNVKMGQDAEEGVEASIMLDEDEDWYVTENYPYLGTAKTSQGKWIKSFVTEGLIGRKYQFLNEWGVSNAAILAMEPMSEIDQDTLESLIQVSDEYRPIAIMLWQDWRMDSAFYDRDDTYKGQFRAQRENWTEDALFKYIEQTLPLLLKKFFEAFGKDWWKMNFEQFFLAFPYFVKENALYDQSNLPFPKMFYRRKYEGFIYDFNVPYSDPDPETGMMEPLEEERIVVHKPPLKLDKPLPSDPESNEEIWDERIPEYLIRDPDTGWFEWLLDYNKPLRDKLAEEQIAFRSQPRPYYRPKWWNQENQEALRAME